MVWYLPWSFEKLSCDVLAESMQKIKCFNFQYRYNYIIHWTYLGLLHKCMCSVAREMWIWISSTYIICMNRFLTTLLWQMLIKLETILILKSELEDLWTFIFLLWQRFAIEFGNWKGGEQFVEGTIEVHRGRFPIEYNMQNLKHYTNSSFASFWEWLQ